jgi:hypothetical protein
MAGESAQCHLVFPELLSLHSWWGGPPGGPPWSAADAHVGLLGLDESDFTGEERVQGDPRRPGGLPHDCIWIPSFGKTKWYWALPHANRLLGYW